MPPTVSHSRPNSRSCWWRKWLVRGLVFSVAAAFVVAVLLYQTYTNSTEIRRRVIEHIAQNTNNVSISLESAQLRLLGGIAVNELRLSRKDDPDHTEILYVPSGIIYHDKEQLLKGKLAVRKIELFRPRVRLVRQADGRWNFLGVNRPPPLDDHQPTFVIHHGTVIVEDRATPGAAPVEWKDCSFTMVNDPLPTFAFSGSAEGDLTGEVKFRGHRDRPTNEIVVELEAPAVPVGPATAQRLAAYNPDAAAHFRMLKGTAKIDARVSVKPEPREPDAEGDPNFLWDYTADAHLTQGEFNHAVLPWPLTDIDATVKCVNGRVPLLTLAARAGATKIHATAHEVEPCKAQNAKDLESFVKKLDVVVKDLDVNEKVFQSLPKEPRSVRRLFEPKGLADVSYSIERDDLNVPIRKTTIEARDMTALPLKFPYPVSHLHGTVQVRRYHGDDDETTIDLTGQASGQPIHAKGRLYGTGKLSGVDVKIWGKNLPLDDKVTRAVSKKVQPVIESFNASGLLDFEADIVRAYQREQFTNTIKVHVHEGKMCFKGFPYPVENVSGDLELYPEGWEFKNFRGRHNNGDIQAWAKCVPLPRGLPITLDAKPPPPPDPPPGAAPPSVARSSVPRLEDDDDFEEEPEEEDDRPHRLQVHINGQNVALDADMEKALVPHRDMARAWGTFHPTGRVDLECDIVKLPDPATPEIELTVDAKGCSIQPDFFRWSLNDMRGRIHYGRQWVELDQITARHGDSAMALKGGSIYLKPAGGVWAELRELRGAPLVPDEEFLEALPETMRKACKSLELRDPLTVSTKIVLDVGSEPQSPTTIYWDGWAGMREGHVNVGVPLEGVTGWAACCGVHNGKQLEDVVGNLQLSKATLFKQPFTDIHSQILVTKDQPEVLRIPGLYAKYFGGEVYGPIRAEFGPTLRYEMRLTASQLKLEEFGKHNMGGAAELSGPAVASLYLSGQGTDINNLRGSGTIDVPEGKMYNLPLLVDLIKVLGLRLPDRTAFEEAHADFEIFGPKAKVKRIDLVGNAISLRGKGELNLDGSDLNLDFNVDLARWWQLPLPSNIKKIPPAFSDQLLKIKMRGSVGDVRFDKEVVPALTGPMKQIINGKDGQN